MSGPLEKARQRRAALLARGPFTDEEVLDTLADALTSDYSRSLSNLHEPEPGVLRFYLSGRGLMELQLRDSPGEDREMGP